MFNLSGVPYFYKFLVLLLFQVESVSRTVIRNRVGIKFSVIQIRKARIDV